MGSCWVHNGFMLGSFRQKATENHNYNLCREEESLQLFPVCHQSINIGPAHNVFNF